LIPEISAGEIAAEDPVLVENIADDREEGEMSSPSENRDLEVPGEDTRTPKIRRVVCVRIPLNQCLPLFRHLSITQKAIGFFWVEPIEKTQLKPTPILV